VRVGDGLTEGEGATLGATVRRAVGAGKGAVCRFVDDGEDVGKLVGRIEASGTCGEMTAGEGLKDGKAFGVAGPSGNSVPEGSGVVALSRAVPWGDSVKVWGGVALRVCGGEVALGDSVDV
jgi:hypothetical protein